jgi:hypothetical protein
MVRQSGTRTPDPEPGPVPATELVSNKVDRTINSLIYVTMEF